MIIYIVYFKNNLFLYILPFPKNNWLRILLVPTARTWTSWKHKYNLFTLTIINVFLDLRTRFNFNRVTTPFSLMIEPVISYLLGNCSCSTETQYLAFDSDRGDWLTHNCIHDVKIFKHCFIIRFCAPQFTIFNI